MRSPSPSPSPLPHSHSAATSTSSTFLHTSAVAVPSDAASTSASSSTSSAAVQYGVLDVSRGTVMPLKRVQVDATVLLHAPFLRLFSVLKFCFCQLKVAKLTSNNIAQQVSNFVGKVSVTQTFFNTSLSSAECVYLFPIDDTTSAVHHFSVAMSEIFLEGKVLEKEDAFNQYDDSIAR